MRFLIGATGLPDRVKLNPVFELKHRSVTSSVEEDVSDALATTAKPIMTFPGRYSSVDTKSYIGKNSMKSVLEGKQILVTGGTGSFGQSFVRLITEYYGASRVVCYSRDEMKQWEMAKNFQNDDRIRFFIGDVRDKERLRRAMSGLDIVVHAAATKIVPTAEYNPFECIKTNIFGGMNVVEAAIDSGVERVVALSTDKASSPCNLYGSTKLASDKLFIASNASYAQGHKTRFAVVRYGNVIGSRGSILPFWESLANKDTLPVTDIRMTRFVITMKEAMDLVLEAIGDMEGGEIYVKKLPSIKIVDLARAFNPKASIQYVGIRPGEKLHEEMISEWDASTTYEYESHYKILPSIYNWSDDPKRVKGGQNVSDGFVYSSDKNENWLTDEELHQLVHRFREGFSEKS